MAWVSNHPQGLRSTITSHGLALVSYPTTTMRSPENDSRIVYASTFSHADTKSSLLEPVLIAIWVYFDTFRTNAFHANDPLPLSYPKESSSNRLRNRLG